MRGVLLQQIGALAGLGALLLLMAGFDPRTVATDWQSTKHVPFAVNHSLEIAEHRFPLKQGSLNLLCSGQELHLMAQTRLPFPGYVRDNFLVSDAFDDAAYIGFGDPRGRVGPRFSLKTAAAIVDLSTVDTIVTAPLEPFDVGLILEWYFKRNSDRVSLSIAETGNAFSASASADALAGFVKKCRGRTPSADQSSGAG